jgi:hypothetical protein
MSAPVKSPLPFSSSESIIDEWLIPKWASPLFEKPITIITATNATITLAKTPVFLSMLICMVLL